MRTCKYIPVADVPNTYMTLSKCVKKGKYHGCFYVNGDETKKTIVGIRQTTHFGNYQNTPTLKS